MQRWTRKKTSGDNDLEQVEPLKETSLFQRLSFRFKTKQEPEGAFSSEELTILHHEIYHFDEQILLPPSALSGRTSSITSSWKAKRLAIEGARDLLPDDPTVEESIECVFARQLEIYQSGLMDESIPDDEAIQAPPDIPYVASMKQANDECIPETSFCGLNFTEPVLRDDCQVSEQAPLQNDSKLLRKSLKSGKVTFLASMNGQQRNKMADLWAPYDLSTNLEKRNRAVIQKVCTACVNGTNTTPCADTRRWPQRPLFLRPTPGSGTIVRGVRYAAYPTFSSPDDTTSYPPLWQKYLEQTQVSSEPDDNQDIILCPQCCCIPINNGNETMEDTLVIDFESPLFIGTMLVRIRASVGTTSSPYDDKAGYFSGMQRQYQAVVRGRFKSNDIPMTECVTGQIFRRPFDKSPPFILKVLTFFAPLLQAKLDGPYPYFLSPLGSTPQVVIVDPVDNNFADLISSASVATHLEEPSTDTNRLVPIASSVGTNATAMVRAKARKKAFDALCVAKEKITFDEDKLYTFEFLQHLLDYNTFEINLGSVLGKMKLKDSIGAQPAMIFAAHQRPIRKGDNMNSTFTNIITGSALDVLWSFDIWHEGMVKSYS